MFRKFKLSYLIRKYPKLINCNYCYVAVFFILDFTNVVDFISCIFSNVIDFISCVYSNVVDFSKLSVSYKDAPKIDY